MNKALVFKKASASLWIIAGILLIAAGICCFIWPTQVLSTLAYWIGAILMISGIVSFAGYIINRKEIFGGEALLFQSLITFFLGLMLMLNNVVVSTILIYAFSVWIFIVGIMRILNSVRMKEIHASKWWTIMVEGIICVILGSVSFFIPSATKTVLGILAGVYLLLIGIALLCDIFFIKKFKANMKKAIRERDKVIIDITPDDK